MGTNLPSRCCAAQEMSASQWMMAPSSVVQPGSGHCPARAARGSEEALYPFPAQTGTPAGSCGPPAGSLDPDVSPQGWHC